MHLIPQTAAVTHGETLQPAHNNHLHGVVRTASWEHLPGLQQPAPESAAVHKCNSYRVRSSGNLDQRAQCARVVWAKARGSLQERQGVEATCRAGAPLIWVCKQRVVHSHVPCANRQASRLPALGPEPVFPAALPGPWLACSMSMKRRHTVSSAGLCRRAHAQRRQ